MSVHTLESGEKIFVIHRPLFPGDPRRHFFGSVEACEGDLARVTGRSFALDPRSNTFSPRDRSRTRVIPLATAGVMVNILPLEVNIDQIKYSSIAGGQLRITDGSDWHLDINPV